MKKSLLAVMAAGVFFLSSCGEGSVSLSGSGASFPQPLYNAMFETYYNETGIEVDYASIGSSGGQQAIIDMTVDFGASDKPMDDEKMEEIDGELIHIPTCVGGIVLAYNLPGNPELKLDGETIAKIFMGDITQWNDEAIVALNPEIELPAKEIDTVHRSDGSGTTFNFTDYLSSVSEDWADEVGMGKTVVWPCGVGQQQNAGVSAYISANEGSIGYTELAYANQNALPVASVKNAAGNFVLPTAESISLAGDADIPADTRVSIVNTDAELGYPISTFTWLLLYKEQSYDGRSLEQATALIDLIWWMTHDAQTINESLDFAPLPDSVVAKVEDLLNSVVYNGESIR